MQYGVERILTLQKEKEGYQEYWKNMGQKAKENSSEKDLDEKQEI